jgi:hypothetical protein
MHRAAHLLKAGWKVRRFDEDWRLLRGSCGKGKGSRIGCPHHEMSDPLSLDNLQEAFPETLQTGNLLGVPRCF